MHRIALFCRLTLAATFMYSGVVKLMNPWYKLAASIIDFRVGITEQTPFLHALSVAIPWSEVVIAILLLFPLRWVIVSSGALLMAFLSLGVASELRGMTVVCGCWGGDMLVGPLWFLEHGAMFVGALVADEKLLRWSVDKWRGFAFFGRSKMSEAVD